MTTILQGSQGLGLSRLCLPFLVGTFFTANRNWATVIGFIVYTIGGWGSAMLYFLFFAGICRCFPMHIHAWLRSTMGHVPVTYSRPPGFFGLNYGRRTPLTTMLGQMVYGATLGGLCQMANFFAGAPG